MSLNRTIEIPLPKVVHSYFSHPCNLGSNPKIEKRHWLGKHFLSIMSYLPLSETDLPLKEIEKSVDDYEIFEFEITFPVKFSFITGHHIWALTACMESIFEISLMNFCRGRFYFAPNYHAAIDDFFKRYDLMDIDVDRDYFRRFVNKKYGPVINEELKQIELTKSKNLSEQLRSALKTA
ncbi:hypothetical protein [Jiulongibacter sp. NS-SX5]|uniref:hypothetical protein n=1 Tax=Jiulongibacter sp. NS-SX5 TaxID=3463854 RepID=UPI004059BFF6